ncbi:DUF1768-domain-containing protein [Aureobasidium sp. EXF-3400]|nr:DUF1768-domain-containing protein [Aureobasidium sp. EXF-12344]KAI4783386.1 DUF1768-domain-containing protein [Aureobasidium sp. EXF-3400]
MAKKQKTITKTQSKKSAKCTTKAQQQKHEDTSGGVSGPLDNPVHEEMPAMSREKHNKKSIRPPVFLHREYEEPHGYLSQWYISSFTDPSTNQRYNCAEQYMMHQKAVSHNDETTATAILNTPYPKEQKDLGRGVSNWDDAAWNEIREKVVEEGSYMKFSQNKELRERLLMTGDRELVEASASDRVWGIGFNAKSALSKREEWGTNVLGKCLMRARERIRVEKETGQSGKEAL